MSYVNIYRYRRGSTAGSVGLILFVLNAMQLDFNGKILFSSEIYFLKEFNKQRNVYAYFHIQRYNRVGFYYYKQRELKYLYQIMVQLYFVLTLLLCLVFNLHLPLSFHWLNN